MQIEFFGRSFDRGGIIGLVIVAGILLAAAIFAGKSIFPPALTITSVQTVDAIAAVDRVSYSRPHGTVLMGGRELKYTGSQRIVLTHEAPLGHYLLIHTEIAQRHLVKKVERDEFNDLRIPTNQIKAVCGSDELDVFMLEAAPLEQPMQIGLAALIPDDPERAPQSPQIPGISLVPFPAGKLEHEPLGGVTQPEDESQPIKVESWGTHKFAGSSGMQVTWAALGDRMSVTTDEATTAWIQMLPKEFRQKQFFDFTKWGVRLLVRRPPSGNGLIRLKFFGEEVATIPSSFANDAYARSDDVFQFVERSVAGIGDVSNSVAEDAAPAPASVTEMTSEPTTDGADESNESLEGADPGVDGTTSAITTADDGPTHHLPLAEIVHKIGSDATGHVAINRSGRVVAVADDSFPVTLFDAKNGKQIQMFANHANPICALAISSDGRFVLSAEDRADGGGVVKLWSSRSGDEVRSISVDDAEVESVALSDNTRVAVIARSDHVLSVWDTKKNQRIAQLPTQGSAISCLRIARDNRVACCIIDGTLRCYDLAKREEIRRFAPDQAALTCLALPPSPDKILVAAHAKDNSTGTVLLYNFNSGEVERTLAPHPGRVNDMALSADGSTLVSVATDGSVRFFSVESGAELQPALRLSQPGHVVSLLGTDLFVAAVRDAEQGGSAVLVGKRR